MTSTVVCPACGAENVEALPGVSEGVTPEYRCLDCGNEFDASGGAPPLADSDEPNAP